MYNKLIKFARSAPDSQRRSAFARGLRAALGHPWSRRMKMTEIVLVVATLVAWSVNAHAETSELKELQGIAIIAGALLVCSQDSAFSAEARQSFGALTAEFESRISEYLKQQYKQVALKDASSRDRAAEVSEIDKRAEKLTLFQAEGARGIQKNEITCMQAAGSALKR